MDWTVIRLNDYEGRVLKSLMTLGESSVNDIAKDSKVPRNKVYEVLEILMEKGFITKTNISPLKYSADNAQEKISEVLEKREKQEKTFIKELENIEKKPKKKKNLRIYEGKQNWYRALRYSYQGKALFKPKTPFSYAIKSVFEYHPQYMKKRQLISEGKRVDYRNIGPINKETIKNVEKFKKAGTKVKHFDNKNVAVSINKLGVVIGLLKENATIVITDKDFTKMMKNLLEAAWKGL
jgi:predicted transcriptional regulator